MSQAFAIHDAAALHAQLDRKAVIEAVRGALIAHAEGEVQSPMPLQLVFPDVHGDCHIKAGHRRGDAAFVAKIATGFYQNPALGMPVNNGLVLAFDAVTGAPISLFLDEGWLTAWRTAAAVALAISSMVADREPVIGIVGTGLQARLALEWIPELLPSARFAIFGRSAERARALADQSNATVEGSIKSLLANVQVLVTLTCASEPLFAATAVRPGTVIVAAGADGEGKQELPPALFARASHVIVDDLLQCVKLSDTGAAVAAGCFEPAAALLLGDLLAKPAMVPRTPRDISIVDLTGLAGQDAAIASLFTDQIRTRQRDLKRFQTQNDRASTVL